jgi:hypothetical protein
MSNDIVETKMFTIFQLVNDWLKFAEAKNLAIIALSGAACSTLTGYLGSSQALSPNLKKVLLVPVSFFALGCVASLLSFAPRTSQEKLLALFPDWGKPSGDDNLYFYKDLGKYQKAADLAGKYQALFAPPSDASAGVTVSSAHTQLAAQIIANSRIVVYKLRFFGVALLLAVLATAIILCTLIYKGVTSS